MGVVSHLALLACPRNNYVFSSYPRVVSGYDIYVNSSGIAQAIIHEPDVIILDEPTVGLDPIQIREIRDLIRELGSRHGVILSTHILPEVQTVCNRINILHEGRIVYRDTDAAANDTGQLTVRFDQEIDIKQLLEIPSIANVDQQPEHYVVHHHIETNPASDIARLAVENNWDLLELTPSTMGLEQIFVSLTQGEQHEAESEHVEDAA